MPKYLKNREMIQTFDHPIAAVCTPAGSGAIAVIRVSGTGAVELVEQAWRGRELTTLHHAAAAVGHITAADGSDIDQCVAAVFRAPRSFTGQDTVEIGCHGSRYIQRQLLTRLMELGARPAGHGEFSQRAFANGKIDLAQAEGIADLIAAESRAAHRLALSQTTGAFSRKINELRSRLIDLASMLELEIDFSEEDVTFADRTELRRLTALTLETVKSLADTYRDGRAFKNGIPTAIAGIPNAGKSTLLNALLGDDKAIVSDIPGTTRDTIEDTLEIGGMLFRFIDTAGLRQTTDTIERLGIERTQTAIRGADIVLWLIDPTADAGAQRREMLETLAALNPAARLIPVLTKADLAQPSEYAESVELDVKELSLTDLSLEESDLAASDSYASPIKISAKNGEGIDRLREKIKEEAVRRHNPDQELLVTNARHYEALKNAIPPLTRVLNALAPGAAATAPPSRSTAASPAAAPAAQFGATGASPTAADETQVEAADYAYTVPSDLLAIDIRESLHHLGEITGEITPADLLQTIFSRFCIGK